MTMDRGRGDCGDDDAGAGGVVEGTHMVVINEAIVSVFHSPGSLCFEGIWMYSDPAVEN